MYQSGPPKRMQLISEFQKLNASMELAPFGSFGDLLLMLSDKRVWAQVHAKFSFERLGTVLR